MVFGTHLLTKAFESLHGGGITWNKFLCSRYRWRRSTCRSCVQACPEKALAFNGTLAIDTERCNGCGVCLAQCPNGALHSARVGDHALLTRMTLFLSENPQVTLRLACRERPPDQNTFTLSCLSRVTTPLLAGPFCAAVRQVEIARPHCEGCHGRLDSYSLEKTVSLAQGICEMAGLGNRAIALGVEWPGGHETPKERAISRRGAVRILRTEILNTLSSIFVRPGDGKNLPHWSRQANVSRDLLLALVQALGCRRPVTVDREGLPLAEVEISPACVGCTVCSTLCPAGAIELLEQENSIFLSFLPHLCTACGICIEACLPKAISFKPQFDLGKLASRQTVSLGRLPRVKCTGCQADFYSAGDELCLACRAQNGARPRLLWESHRSKG
ncbi:MAG: 4Fe-4S dicluster domain-containing protein [Chloroflexi bacterium]|nr:4Fe-4S dicluster domain-containing protein [Chloroflexota bacterium]